MVLAAFTLIRSSIQWVPLSHSGSCCRSCDALEKQLYLARLPQTRLLQRHMHSSMTQRKEHSVVARLAEASLGFCLCAASVWQQNRDFSFSSPQVINIINAAQESSPVTVAEALDRVLEILRTTELYSPQLASKDDDPHTNDLVGGLMSVRARWFFYRHDAGYSYLMLNFFNQKQFWLSNSNQVCVSAAPLFLFLPLMLNKPKYKMSFSPISWENQTSAFLKVRLLIHKSQKQQSLERTHMV